MRLITRVYGICITKHRTKRYRIAPRVKLPGSILHVLVAIAQTTSIHVHVHVLQSLILTHTWTVYPRGNYPSACSGVPMYMYVSMYTVHVHVHALKYMYENYTKGRACSSIVTCIRMVVPSYCRCIHCTCTYTHVVLLTFKFPTKMLSTVTQVTYRLLVDTSYTTISQTYMYV